MKHVCHQPHLMRILPERNGHQSVTGFVSLQYYYGDYLTANILNKIISLLFIQVTHNYNNDDKSLQLTLTQVRHT